jgi:hypothetical protein
VPRRSATEGNESTEGPKQPRSRESRNVEEVKQQKGWKAAVVIGLCKMRVVSSVAGTAACARILSEGANELALV